VRNFMSIAEAASYLGVSREWVRQLVISRRLPAERTAGAWLISAAAAEKEAQMRQPQAGLIAAAVRRGAIRPERAAVYARLANEGHDLSFLAHLASWRDAGPDVIASAPVDGDGEDREYEELHLALWPPATHEDLERQEAARERIAAAREAKLDDEDALYESIFGPGAS
jgi:excisionase family DNA binding protein